MSDSVRTSEQTASGNAEPFVLEGELSIYAASALKADLLSALTARESLVVDLSGVTVMDGAGVQLLVMLKQEASHQGKALSLTGHSEAVLKTLDLTNLAGYFGDTLVLAPEAHH